ncbi:DUF4230 domain-containing protein [Treponema sp. OMZ 840]|uniref:DUF4230 domain-containing protein n=1 Tax=Treponema sp. OMZ 840 TaxID=244313 RepID=UPI003D8D7BD5
MTRLHKKTPPFLRRLLIKIILILVGAAGLVLACFYGWKEYDKQRFAALSAMVSGELMHCAELTVVKAVYSDIVSLKRQEVLGLAKSYSIIRYSGTVRAGIEDFSAAEFILSPDRTSITVRLPPVKILANDISSMEVFDEYKNIFAPISSQDIFTEIDNAKNRVEQTFIVQGLIQDAEIQAVLVVRRILSAMGFRTIEVLLQD